MNKATIPVSFFFGANNKARYCSLFDEIYNPYEEGKHIILKGGPGTGKSTLMKKVADKLESEGCFVERGYCSADPSSLDIVIAPEINFSILDGTSPHTFDPKMPGVSEHIVDLGASWDRKLLNSHISEISALMRDNSLQHRKTAEFMRVASQLESENASICAVFTDKEKLERFAKRLAYRLIPEKKNASDGKIQKRFLSAISPEGIVTKHETVVALSEKIVTIEDEYSCVAPFIAEYISAFAVANGYDIYKCYCPLFPRFKLEHIIIPELKLTVFTQNNYHFAIDDGEKTIHASRFYSKELFDEAKQKLAFRKKAKREFLDEAVKKLSLAKNIHDELEAYYIEATDFDIINELSEKILKSI